MITQAYKIVETHNTDVKTLFHGVAGSRTITPGTWIKAEEKLVKDGTSKTTYLSGWHVLLTKEDAEDYMKVFTTRRELLKIVPVKVKNIRPKVHSRSPVFLVKYMMLEV
jgi:hypothetical protein